MKVLVTGGAGFVGSAVVRLLVAEGADVTVLDDLSSGKAEAVPCGVEIIQRDVANDGTGDLITRLRPSHVLHAAAQVRVERSMGDPVHDRRVNLDGTRHVVDASRRAGVRRLVFVSSGGAVYGEASGATESTAPAPRSYYGVHKLAAEGYVTIGGCPYSIARLANVYGPGQRADLEGGVVAIFMREVIAGQPVTIHGDGHQERDFVHVDDVADALVRMLNVDDNGVWNVATGSPTTVNQLLGLVESTVGRTVDRNHVASRIGDVRASWLAVEAIERDLKWRARTSLMDGLRAMASPSTLVSRR